MDEDVLYRLCGHYGIEPGLHEVGDEAREAAAERLNDLLAALGEDVADDQARQRALADLDRRHWQRFMDPVLVLPEKSGPCTVVLRLPEEDLAWPGHWNLIEENGAVHQGDFQPAALEVRQRGQCDGRSYAAVDLTLSIAPPTGYHRLAATIRAGDRPYSAELSLIITPATCYIPPSLDKETRIWGVSCQLYAVRSRRNWGIGDFTDLGNLLVWSAENGAGTVAVQPLHPTLTTGTAAANPYQPAARYFLNPLYLDPEAIDVLPDCQEAVDLVRDPGFQARLASLRDKELVDYPEVAEIKMKILGLLWQHFLQNHLNPETEKGRVFREFQAAAGENLRAYSLFEALRAHFAKEAGGQGWPAWPAAYQDPHAPAVAAFAAEHQEDLEFHQFMQWQAMLQLAVIGRRSQELGLKVGLLQSVALSVAAAGFETWYNRPLFAVQVEISTSPADSLPSGRDRGQPPVIPARLVEAAYQPFIDLLRANMYYAGALWLGNINHLDRLYWRPPGRGPAAGAYVGYPTADLLGIIALESQRNRCLVIGADHGRLSPKLQEALARQAIFPCHLGYFGKEASGEWYPPARYPAQALVAVSRHDLPTLAGFWLGRDIAQRTELALYASDLQREKQIIARASDRAHLLVALSRAELLPEGYGLDPATVPEITPELARAVHLFFAKTPARIFLLQLDDMLGQLDQTCLPGSADRFPNWQRKLVADLEVFQEETAHRDLFRQLCRERGVGVVRPSALLADRRSNKAAAIPRSFYRLQFNKDFTFSAAAALVPYLQELGISHCYASSYLKARPSSPHGYDIIDHAALNPEIGSRAAYEEFVAALAKHDMAQILDFVSNHMGVGSDNSWWVDVLENGQASAYADFFDINWLPQQEELKGRLLLPVLGDYYGNVLENGELRLAFSQAGGHFSIGYYEQRFPVEPTTYADILELDLPRLQSRLGAQHTGYLELQSLIASFRNLPAPAATAPEQREMRQRNKEVLKRLLARLCREVPEITAFVEENVILFNGEPGRAEGFDLFHGLLNRQCYRLAFWRVAADEVNYRRFFDINDLAGIRVENKRVFEATHRFVLDLIAIGKVDGLRIDHIDGLYDPRQYCARLQAAVGGGPLAKNAPLAETAPARTRQLPLYVVVEKILATFEQLPLDWQVFGTTGYDFANLLNGLYIDPAAEKVMTRIYNRFLGHKLDFDKLLYEAKRLIIKSAMSGELNVLAIELLRLAKKDRHTQDFTLNSLREALIEIVAVFPVYRTYITDQVSRHDRNYIEWAVARARSLQQSADTSIYDFIRGLLLLDSGAQDSEQLGATTDFIKKLQQYTGPVMAKGLEDTACYVYNRLLSLNDVGGDPRQFSTTVAVFHRANLERDRHWPHAMLNTSTHDSKRSEDVRARINVLSEMPEEWRQALQRWYKFNRSEKTLVDKRPAPTRNDEYGFYQNLLGAWPLADLDREGRRAFMARIEAYMLKAIREAKVHSSWINPNSAYEEAMTKYVRGVLAEEDSGFARDFAVFRQKIAWFGLLNSLSQLMLKLTAPGVPDIYQGNEIWSFRLVDPDNRRPVDFAKRQKMLAELREYTAVAAAELPERVRRLLDNLADGRVKMYVIWRALGCRRQHPDLFEQGSYLSLTVAGAKDRHLCAFARISRTGTIIVAVPRLVAGLLAKEDGRLPLGREVWDDTRLILPADLPAATYVNILTGEQVEPAGAGQRELPAATLFNSFPVALLGSSTIDN